MCKTRARKTLHLITAMKSGGARTAHSFINRLPQENVEFYKYVKTNRQKTPFVNYRAFIRYFDQLSYRMY